MANVDRTDIALAQRIIKFRAYDEQKKIADYITDKVNHIEVEIDKRNKLIKKYQEYKKSLIYEVVTGKKEV